MAANTESDLVVSIAQSMSCYVQSDLLTLLVLLQAESADLLALSVLGYH